MKRRRQATAFREGVEPTPEQLARGEWETVEAPRIVGHDHGNVRIKRRKVPWARWLANGWVTRDQFNAIERFCGLFDRCRYTSVRSSWPCDDRVSGGGFRGGPNDAMIDAQAAFQALRLQLHREVGKVQPVNWLVYLCMGDGTDDELMARFIGGGERTRRRKTQEWAKKIGEGLERIFSA